MRKLFAVLVLALAGAAGATVPSTTSSVSYTCNGTTTVYAVPFRFLESSHLVVTKKETATGTVTALVVTTDYTVTNTGTVSGGSVTLTAGSKCGSGYTLTVKRTVPLTQGTSFRSQGSFSPATHENAFDKDIMIAQQVDRRVAEAEATHSSDIATVNANRASDLSSQASRDSGQDVALSQARADFGAGAGGFGDGTNIMATGALTARQLRDWFADCRNVKGYYASGAGDTSTTGSITSGTNSLTVASAATFEAGQGISVAGAGAAGALLVTSITAINGTTFTLAVNASTTVAGTAVKHDDTAAIQEALDDYVSQRAFEFPVACIDVPGGVYLVSSSLILNGRSYRIRGTGMASKILGSFPDYIFKKDDASIVTFPILSRLWIVNTHATGGAFSSSHTHGLHVEDVQLEGHTAYYTGANSFSTYASNITLRRTGDYAGSLGMTGISTNVNPDAQGFEVAFKLGGTNINVFGGRTEVCGTAFLLGIDHTGAPNAWASSEIVGHTLEANDIAFDIRSAQSSTIKNVNTGATTNAPSGDPSYGLKISGANGLVIDNASVAFRFSRAAVYADESNSRVVFRNVATNNSHPSGLGKRWDIFDPKNFTFENTDYAPAGTATEVGRRTESASIRTLSFPSAMVPPVQGKNLRGLNLAVGAAATSVAIQFPPTINTFSASMATATATTGGTLAAGTYYYCGVVVNEYGETLCRIQDKIYTVVIGGANNATAITFHNMDAGKGIWKRRVYRGRSWAGDPAKPDFDGYYDMPLNSDAAFTDTGAAFTGLKSPSWGDQADLGAPEPDANYAILCTPAWNATCWATAKATTGFTLNFSAAPGGAGSTVDWFLVR